MQRAGQGEPMVLLHGIGGELCVWEPVLGGLARNFEVIALDLPGFGRSRPLADGTVPTARALAEAIAAALDGLGADRVHAVGNSLGGWVALELATMGRALTVTALCPAGLWRRPVLAPGEVVRGRAHRAVRWLGPVVPAALLEPHLRHVALRSFVAHPERVPYRAATRIVRSYGRATAYDATATAMRRGHFSGAAQLSVPVTLAFGDRDRLIRPAELRTHAVRRILLPDCGHVPMWDDPELVRAVIESTARGEPIDGPAALRAQPVGSR